MPLLINVRVGDKVLDLIERPDAWELQEGFLMLATREPNGVVSVDKGYNLNLVEAFEVVDEETARQVEEGFGAEPVKMDDVEKGPNPFRGGHLKYKGEGNAG